MNLDALAEAATRAEKRLAVLPEPARRDPAQRRAAGEIKTAVRRVRAAFLDARADEVYDAVTDGRRRPVPLAGVIDAAAHQFPGLLPSAPLLAADQGRRQADKEGWEVDQGLFVRAVLRSPVAGRHLLETMLRPTPRALRELAAFRSTGTADLGSVRLRRDGARAELTMCREDCLNAEDARQVDDMETAVDLVALDGQCRVGVLRGGPMTHPKYAGRRVFSSGINLKELHAGRISLLDFLLRREMGYLSKLMRGVRVDGSLWPDQPVVKPWVAGVDGFAIGGGAQLLLVLDRVVAARDAYFCLPAAQEGIVPGVANLRLTRAVGARAARQILLWGRRVHADEADAALVFDDVVAPEAVATAVVEAADRLDNAAVVANRRMLHLAEEPLDAFRCYLAEFALQQALRLYSPDVLSKVGRFAG